VQANVEISVRYSPLMTLLIAFIKYRDSFKFCSEWHRVESDCLEALELDNSLTKVRVNITFKDFVDIVVQVFDHDALVTLYQWGKSTKLLITW
jgi:hypothetical protein